MRNVLAKVVFFATLVLKVVPAVIDALDAYEKAKPKEQPKATAKKSLPDAVGNS